MPHLTAQISSQASIGLPLCPGWWHTRSLAAVSSSVLESLWLEIGRLTRKSTLDVPPVATLVMFHSRRCLFFLRIQTVETGNTKGLFVFGIEEQPHGCRHVRCRTVLHEPDRPGLLLTAYPDFSENGFS